MYSISTTRKASVVRIDQTLYAYTILLLEFTYPFRLCFNSANFQIVYRPTNDSFWRVKFRHCFVLTEVIRRWFDKFNTTSISD